MAEYRDVASSEDILKIANAIRAATGHKGDMTIPEMAQVLLNEGVKDFSVEEHQVSLAGPAGDKLVADYSSEAPASHLFLVVPKQDTDISAMKTAGVNPVLLYDSQSSKLYLKTLRAVSKTISVYVVDMPSKPEGTTVAILAVSLYTDAEYLKLASLETGTKLDRVVLGPFDGFGLSYEDALSLAIQELVVAYDSLPDNFILCFKIAYDDGMEFSDRLHQLVCRKEDVGYWDYGEQTVKVMTKYIVMLNVDRNEKVTVTITPEGDSSHTEVKTIAMKIEPNLVAQVVCGHMPEGDQGYFDFDLGSVSITELSGMYVFTAGNCFIQLPLFNPVVEATYKIVGTFIYNHNDGSVKTTTVNYKVINVSGRKHLWIWSGDTAYKIDMPGYTGYLFKALIN